MTHLISLVVVIVHVQGWLRAKAKQASSRCGGADRTCLAKPLEWARPGLRFSALTTSVPSLAETNSDVNFKANDWPKMMSITRKTNNVAKIEV